MRRAGRASSPPGRARVTIEQQVALTGMMLAVHSVFERFVIPQVKPEAQPPPIIATNVSAHRRRLAHDRAPRLARAGAGAERPARRRAENPALDASLAVAARRPSADPMHRCARRRACRSSAAAGKRPTATSSTSTSPATQAQIGASRFSTVSRAARTATTRARSPPHAASRGGASRSRTGAGAPASRTSRRARTTPATATKWIG